MSGQTDIQTTLHEMWTTRPARPRDDRKIAGVAAAIARRYDIDPVLVRVGFVVLAFYGIGFLLYLAGWVLLPDAGYDAAAAPGEPARPTPRPEPHPILLIVLIIAAIGTGSAVVFGNPGTLIALAVAGGLLYLLHRNRGDRVPVGAATTSSATSAPRPTGPAASSTVPTAAAGSATTSTATTSTATTSSATTSSAATGAPSADAPGRPGGSNPSDGNPSDGSGSSASDAGPTGQAEPPAWDPLGAAPFAWDLPEPSSPAPPPAPQPAGWLGPVTLGLALLAGGIAGAAVLAFGELAGLRIVFGVVLGVLGLGLVAGAFVRRGRGLIVLAIPMIVLTYALTAAPLQGWRGAGELAVAPTTAAMVAPLYERSVGDLQIDLRGLDLSSPAGTDATSITSTPITSTPITSTIAVDAGNAEVYLPPDADVTVHCSAGAGHINCLGADEGGPGVDSTVTDLGRDGVRSGRPLVLDVSAGLGNVEVHRG